MFEGESTRICEVLVSTVLTIGRSTSDEELEISGDC